MELQAIDSIHQNYENEYIEYENRYILSNFCHWLLFELAF